MEFSNNIIVSYIEEDNEQHSLFHVRPLLDMNGPVSKRLFHLLRIQVICV